MVNLNAFIRSFLFVISILLSLHTATAETRNISSIIFVGLKTIDEGVLRLQLPKQKGTMTDGEISDAAKKIYATGFFEDVSASIREATQLIFTVKEKPRVRKTYVKGNDSVSESTLSKTLTADGSKYFDKAKAAKAIRDGIVVYQNEGYFDASISYDITPVSDGVIDVTYTVDEGKRSYIDEVAFEGLHEVDDADLSKSIDTRPYSWWRSWLTGSGRLNEEALDNDKGIIRQLLLDRGYLESSVGGPRVERDGRKIKVVFEVREGSQYRIGDIIARGDLIEGSVEKTLEPVTSEKGEVFSLSKARKDTFAIAEAFGDRGYAFANVTPDTKLNPSSKIVDLLFNSNKGNLVTVDNINIRGNEKTYENVIRREIKVAEGDQYNTSKIKKSEERLKRLGFFQEASIATQPSLKDSSKVDLNANVKEMNTGSFSIGAGYSTSDGAIVNGRISETNLLGTGRRADLDIDIGSIRRNVSLVLEDRRLNDSHFFGSIEGAVTEREFLDFNRQLVGGGAAFGHPLTPLLGEAGEDIIFSTKYQFYNVDISSVDDDAADFVKASKGKTSAGSIIPRFVRDTLDNPLSPTKGSRQVFSFEKSGLGGDAKYHLFEARNTWYTPLTTTKYGDITFSWRLSAAFGESDDENPYPLFKRYFPGGINSVRGYQARTLGPANASGHEYGGSKEFVTNFDVIFPLLSSAGIRGVLFYDLGNAFDDGKSIDFSELRKAYGFGFRWASPMGPLRIEFGLPSGKKDGEDSLVTMFSFGAPL